MRNVEPDIKLVGLSVWVHGYAYQDATDVDDGNWLSAEVECIGHGSRARHGGAFMMTLDFERFAKVCRAFLDGTVDRAALSPLEPHFDIELTRDRDGLVAKVTIAPVFEWELHEYRFSIDQTHVSLMIQAIAVLLKRFPVRGR